MTEHPNKIDSDDYVYPVIVIPWREGGHKIVKDASGNDVRIPMRVCATEWRVVRPDDNPDTDSEVIASFATEDEAHVKAAEINGES
tara:strand:+ start:397 stop:654 length:258 start_codon:yes stop_codon:yes gene_type:complete